MQYSTDKSNLEKEVDKRDRKIPNNCRFVKNTDYDGRINEIESKIASFIGLVTNALTAVENKRSNANNLVKETN